MTKLIIEVNDELIRKYASIENMENEAKNSGQPVFALMADLVAFTALEHELDKGKGEFTLLQDTVDEKADKIFKDMVRNFGVIYMSQEVSRTNEEKSDLS